jgi:hypothetical protein
MKVILVLGNSNETISNKRIDRAIDYFTSLSWNCLEYFCEVTNTYVTSVYIIMCGGTKNHGLASNMKKYALKRLGESYSKYILLESQSKTTVENIMFSKNILKKMDPEHLSIIEVVVCTSTFHIKRSSVIANYFLAHDYKISLIHTEETSSQEDTERENKHLERFKLNYQLSGSGVQL